MSTAATRMEYEDPPLARVRLYLELFSIHFRDYFMPPPKRWVARGPYAKARAFLRVVEAIARSMFLLQAAALAPTLPQASAKPAAVRRRPPAPAPAAAPPCETDALRPATFQVFRRADFHLPARRIARPAGPRATPLPWSTCGRWPAAIPRFTKRCRIPTPMCCASPGACGGCRRAATACRCSPRRACISSTSATWSAI